MTDAQRTAASLHRAALTLLRRLRREDVAMGLGTARASALSVVVFAGPVTMGRLAEIEQVRAPTMTRMVDRLEADGLVVRVPDPTDRRAVRVEATAKGRRTMETGRDRRVKVLAADLAGLPPRDLATVARAARLLEDLHAGDGAKRNRRG